MDKFIVDSDADLNEGADLLSDASDYSDSPKTKRQNSSAANRYVLKPAATARDTVKSKESNHFRPFANRFYVLQNEMSQKLTHVLKSARLIF